VISSSSSTSLILISAVGSVVGAAVGAVVEAVVKAVIGVVVGAVIEIGNGSKNIVCLTFAVILISLVIS